MSEQYFETTGEECSLEPILFDDPRIELDNSLDTEKELNKLIDIQERMAKGMKLINQISDRLAAAKDGDYLPKDVFLALVNNRKNYWARWFDLKNQAQDIASQHPSLWPEYFKLNEEILTPYYNTSNAEAIDNQDALHDDAVSISDVLRDAHIQEMSAYETNFNENPYLGKDWWDSTYDNKLRNEQFYHCKVKR